MTQPTPTLRELLSKLHDDISYIQEQLENCVEPDKGWGKYPKIREKLLDETESSIRAYFVGRLPEKKKCDCKNGDHQMAINSYNQALTDIKKEWESQ